jgi:hypothetical protein
MELYINTPIRLYDQHRDNFTFDSDTELISTEPTESRGTTQTPPSPTVTVHPSLRNATENIYSVMHANVIVQPNI